MKAIDDVVEVGRAATDLCRGSTVYLAATNLGYKNGSLGGKILDLAWRKYKGGGLVRHYNFFRAGFAGTALAEVSVLVYLMDGPEGLVSGPDVPWYTIALVEAAAKALPRMASYLNRTKKIPLEEMRMQLEQIGSS